MEHKSHIRQRPHYVYLLRCPIDMKIRYIGCTTDPKTREYDHSSLRDYVQNKALYKWVSELRDIGEKPTFEIIKKFDDSKKAFSMEKKLIVKLSDQLYNIFHNYTNKQKDQCKSYYNWKEIWEYYSQNDNSCKKTIKKFNISYSMLNYILDKRPKN